MYIRTNLSRLYECCKAVKNGQSGNKMVSHIILSAKVSVTQPN